VGSGCCTLPTLMRGRRFALFYRRHLSQWKVDAVGWFAAHLLISRIKFVAKARRVQPWFFTASQPQRPGVELAHDRDVRRGTRGGEKGTHISFPGRCSCRPVIWCIQLSKSSRSGRLGVLVPKTQNEWCSGPGDANGSFPYPDARRRFFLSLDSEILPGQPLDCIKLDKSTSFYRLRLNRAMSWPRDSLGGLLVVS
jgi:hypothetical protein